MIVNSKQQLNTNNGVELRTYYESLRGAMESEYSTWRPHHEQLARFVLPRHQRFNYSNTDRGDRVDQLIVDNTATIAHRLLTACLKRRDSGKFRFLHFRTAGGIQPQSWNTGWIDGIPG